MFDSDSDSAAPCLGLNIAACLAAWEASHPRPPAIVDGSLAWPWIAIFVFGLVLIQVLGRRSRADRP